MHCSRRLQTGRRGRLGSGLSPRMRGRLGLGRSGLSPLLRHSPVRAPPPDAGAGGDSESALPVPIHGPHELYLGNWPRSLCELQIAAMFHKYNIYPKDIRLLRKPMSDSYAFVELACAEDVLRAVDQLHGGKVLGHQIVVCRSRRSRQGGERCLPNGDGDMNGACDESECGDEDQEYQSSPPCYPDMPPLVLPAPVQAVRRHVSDRDEEMYGPMVRAKRVCTQRVGGGVSPLPELAEDSGDSAQHDPTPDSGSGQQSGRSSVTYTSAASAAASDLIRRRLHQPVEVLVANFPAGTTELDLMDLFSLFKPISVRTMVSDPGQQPGAFTYAYVTLFSTMMADSAVLGLDGRLYRGHHLVVEVKRS